MQTIDITRKTNKRVMIASFLLILLAISGYMMEYIRGARTISYVLTLSLCLLVPIIFTFIFYQIPRFVDHFKSIALYSFILSWMIMLTFSPKVIQFTLIFPLIIVYVLYFDKKLMRNASILIFVFGIFKVLLNTNYYGMTDDSMSTQHTVFILALVAYGFATYNTISFSMKIRGQQLSSILEEKEKNTQLLKEMTEVLGVIQRTTHGVFSIYDDLLQTSDQAAATIGQLSENMNGIAISISSQNDNSELMQKKLLLTADLSRNAVEQTHHSTQQIYAGRETIAELDTSALTVNQNNDHVLNRMVELEKNTLEIKSIIDIIQKIAAQTNLLALNASIESARAGESGRGFGVVAESIRELSIRTSQSLEGINQLMAKLGQSASESLSAAEASKSLGALEQQLIHDSKGIFDDINTAIEVVNACISSTAQTNAEIVTSNQVVVDCIANVSSVVQEAAANAEIATEMVNTNKELTLKAKAYMDELSMVVNAIETLKYK